jgi:hypothetical protein
MNQFTFILSLNKKNSDCIYKFENKFYQNLKIFWIIRRFLKNFSIFFLILIRLFLETLLKRLKRFNFYVFFQIKYALIIIIIK